MGLPLRLSLTLIALLLASSSLAAPALVLRTAETHPANYPTALALAYMGQQLSDWTDNNITLKLYAGGQLGEEKDTLEITIFGGIDLNRINMAPLNSVVPETIILGLPFLFRSKNHMRAVVDSKIGDEILASLEPHGLIGLAFYDSGARSFYNNRRPIHAPADLRGLKIRVQNSALAVAMVEALGANPTPMGFGQVYESLLLGTIDGSENNWPSYESTGHFEAAPYYTLSRHTMMPEVLVMSKHRWDRLTTEHQVLIRRAAKTSVAYMREQWDKRVATSRAKVLASSAQVIENPHLMPFVKAMQPVYTRFVSSEKMRNLVARIQAVSAKK